MTFERMKPILALVALWGGITICSLALLASYELAEYIPWVILGSGVTTVSVVGVSLGHTVFLHYKDKDSEGRLGVQTRDDQTDGK